MFDRVASYCVQAPERLDRVAANLMVVNAIDLMVYIAGQPPPRRRRRMSSIREVAAAEDNTISSNEIFRVGPPVSRAVRGAAATRDRRPPGQVGYSWPPKPCTWCDEHPRRRARPAPVRARSLRCGSRPRRLPLDDRSTGRPLRTRLRCVTGWIISVYVSTGIAVVTAAVIGFLTGWPVGVLLAGAGGFAAPSLMGRRAAAKAARLASTRSPPGPSSSAM